MNGLGRQQAERNRVLLLCLDTLEVAGDQARSPSAQLWASKAVQLLEHARSKGWIVAHVLPRPPTGKERWRTVEGLAPRPFERVFHRAAPSAFSSVDFAAVTLGVAELVMVGCSSDAALLATVRDGLERGHRIAISADAIAAPAGERAHLAGLARPLPGAEESRLTIQNTMRLLAGAPRLRLLDGGLLSNATSDGRRRQGGGLET